MILFFKRILLHTNAIFCIFSAFLFLLGSVIKFENYSLPLSIGSSIVIIGLWLIQGKNLIFPKNFWFYILFLTSLIIHTFVFHGDATYSILFLSGGLYWFVFSNLNTVRFREIFFSFLVLFGLTMAGLYLGFTAFGINSLISNNLFLPLGENIYHNHLGDVWAVILPGLMYNTIRIKKIYLYLLILLGIVLLTISLSRSAVMSFLAGGFYIYYNSERGKLDKKRVMFVLGSMITIFLFASAFKTTLFSRPYIWQSVEIFISRPLGIGAGNFYKISPQSSVAHNIILEFMVAVGIFTTFFIIWVTRILSNFQKGGANILYAAIFIAILTNFLLDTTYTIPSIIWLWFSALALTKT